MEEFQDTEVSGPSLALPATFAPPKSWGDAVAAVLFALIALVPLLAAIAFAISPKPGTGLAAMFAAVVAILFGAVGWFWWKRSRDQRPVLTLTRAGIESPHISHPLRWEDVDDAELEVRGGASLLRFKIAQGKDVVLKVQRLKRADQAMVFETVHQVVTEQRRKLGRGETATAKQLRESIEFEQTLIALTPHAWAIYAIVAINLLVWVATVISGMSPVKPTAEQLFRWGASSASAVILDGQAWRLFTATFLHAGLLHLAFNMLGLWGGASNLHGWSETGIFFLSISQAHCAGVPPACTLPGNRPFRSGHRVLSLARWAR